MWIVAYGCTSIDDQNLSITDQEQNAAPRDHAIVETILEQESLDRPGP